LGLIENGNGLEIKRYLMAHPERIKAVFSTNQSYVFFEIRNNGPLGALEQVLVPYYSVATDFTIFPKGNLLFIKTEIPSVDAQQKLVGWKPFSSFVLNHDTGGAIKGSGKADIFFGTGPVAEAQACYMVRYGKLYLLVKKK
jgi:membrane-bound lytic murein transglycosylase A